MPEFEIIAEKSALLIIDMTRAFLDKNGPVPVPGGVNLIPGLNKLRTVARKKALLTIFTTMAYHQDGSDLGLDVVFHPDMKRTNSLKMGSADIEFHADIQPVEGDVTIIKSRYSAFVGTELDLILRSHGIDTLIIGGVLTNVCCESTAREARMRDYKVVFLSDGTATRDIPDFGFGRVPAADVQRYTLASIACFFGQVSSIDQVISRLTGGR
jgi:ureidoacrylate peracid hydrolase